MHLAIRWFPGSDFSPDMRLRMLLFAVSFFLLPVVTPAAGGEEARFSTGSRQITLPPAAALRQFSRSRPWLKLLHYKERIFGGYTSQVDSNSFFLARDGKTDPLAELQASIRYLLLDPSGYSRFPARYLLLARHFNWTAAGKANAKLSRFLRANRSASISIAFSSYYMNSPASVFGHLFMKLDNRSSSLLDTGVDFTADTTGAGFFTYFFGGMSGYFAGKYSLIPFHKKLREYNDFENRDVWLYCLRLTEQQRDLFIKHLWELKHIKYDYYFLTENCAYHILSAVEAVCPEYDLTDKTGLLVIPVQSLRILKEAGLVERIEHKLSLRNLFIRSYSALSNEDRKLFHRVITSNTLVNGNTLSIPLLDGLIDFYSYRYPAFRLDRKQPEQSRVFDFKRRLHSMRAGLKQNHAVPDIRSEGVYPPHTIHDSVRFSLAAGYSDRLHELYLKPELRFVFHDLADPLRGYPGNAAIDFLKLSAFLYQKEGKGSVSLLFDQFTLLDYIVLNDFSFFRKSFSRRLYLGAKRLFDSRVTAVTGYFAPEISLSTGISRILGGKYSLESHPALLVYLLLKIKANFSTGFHRNHLSAGGGVDTGLKFIITSRMNLLCSYEFIQFINYKYTHTLHATFRWQLFQDIALDFAFQWSDADAQYQSGLLLYL